MTDRIRSRKGCVIENKEAKWYGAFHGASSQPTRYIRFIVSVKEKKKNLHEEVKGTRGVTGSVSRRDAVEERRSDLCAFHRQFQSWNGRHLAADVCLKSCSSSLFDAHCLPSWCVSHIYSWIRNEPWCSEITKIRVDFFGKLNTLLVDCVCCVLVVFEVFLNRWQFRDLSLKADLCFKLFKA